MMTATSTLALTHASPVFELAKEVDDNKVTPGVLGFIVFAVIGVAVWMLMKSMNTHMKKVDFEEAPATEDQGSDQRESAAKGR
ncbi:hypothetical protein AB0F42_02765 [Streptomyces buecherae]|uniref:hypothetical protein n=1 Tax=Streptomyces buecherae TaxID=2763006 RepID=UPI0033CDCD05